MTIPAREAPGDTMTSAECDCYACDGSPEMRERYYLCATCGNKRCPHATDHRLRCTSSNEPGQPGSYYSEVSVTDALAARVTALEASLREALAEFDDALGYVEEQFVTKWRYRETLARLRGVAGAPSGGAAETVNSGEKR